MNRIFVAHSDSAFAAVDGANGNAALGDGFDTHNLAALAGVKAAIEMASDSAQVLTPSLYAARMAQGKWAARAHAVLIADIRASLAARPGVSVEWLRGGDAPEYAEARMALQDARLLQGFVVIKV